MEKCRFYGIESIFISGLESAGRVKLSILEETYKRFEVLYRNNGVILICNRSIKGLHLYMDALHLLANNYVAYLNNFYLGRTHHREVYI